MDGERFDAVTRWLGGNRSRRAAFRAAAAAGFAALVGARRGAAPVAADHCTYIGCGCSTGTHHACGHGLVCCPSSPGMPGGAGVCTSPGDCGGSCAEIGDYCGDSCNWGDTCPTCCSGYCGSTGACDQATCTGLGCACASGTYQPCDYGLVCCSPYGFPGAQGSCQYSC